MLPGHESEFVVQIGSWIDKLHFIAPRNVPALNTSAQNEEKGECHPNNEELVLADIGADGRIFLLLQRAKRNTLKHFGSRCRYECIARFHSDPIKGLLKTFSRQLNLEENGSIRSELDLLSRVSV